MNKQKLFRVLSVLGVVFAIWVVASYFQKTSNRGALIEEKIEVPTEFSRQFSRVLRKHRYEEMERATFMSPDNLRVNWKVFDGQYLLVNFWATWCPPCVLELPSLDELGQEFEGRGLKVISISMDTARPHEDIKAFLDNRSIGSFAAYFDDASEVKKAVYMRGLPTSYLLNPAGQILYIFEGDANWSSSGATEFFEMVLNSKI